MKKFFLLPLLLSISLTASAQSSAELSFGALTCGYDSVLGDYYDVEIILDNRFVDPCGGFQFEITNVLIDSLYGGWLDQYGWSFTSFNPTYAVDTGIVLAFAFGPPYLPSDLGVLTILRFTNPNNYYSSCLTNFIYADAAANPIPTSVGSCLDLSPTYTQAAAICTGDSIFLQGAWQTTTGTYVDTFTASTGCDSILTTNLGVGAVITNNVSAAICIFDSMFVGGAWQTSAGTYYDTLSIGVGCDSVIITTLSIGAVHFIPVTSKICQGDSILLDGAYQTTAGTYYDSLTTILGCDSVIETTLSIDTVYFISSSVSICQGDSIQLPGGSYASTAGTYQDVFTSVSSCDSVISTTVTVDPVYIISSAASICQGDSVQLPNGAHVTTSGSYTDSLTTAAGCDSVITVIVTVDSIYFTANSDTICAGDTVMVGNSFHTVAGEYYDTLMAISGCDSIIRTTLNVNATHEFWYTVSMCPGDTTMVDSVSYTAAGIYYDSLQTAEGCDSVFILEIILDPTYEIWDTTAICSGDSIMVGNSYYSDAGTYYDSVQTIAGCDSVLVTELNLNALPVPVITQSGNDLSSSSAASYQWYSSDATVTGETSQTYTATVSGSYSVMVTDSNGCSGSSDTLEVTVTAVEEFAVLPILRIFPNPMEDQAVVQFDRSVLQGPYKIVVYNFLGEELLQESFSWENQAIIRRNDLAPGVYFIELEGASTTLVGKFLIK